MSVNLANLLTFSRLFLTPVFVYLYVAEAWMWAFIVFCFAAFTDLIDGTVARMYGQQSKLGGLIDPLADKLLMQSCFVLCSSAGLYRRGFRDSLDARSDDSQRNFLSREQEDRASVQGDLAFEAGDFDADDDSQPRASEGMASCGAGALLAA